MCNSDNTHDVDDAYRRGWQQRERERERERELAIKRMRRIRAEENTVLCVGVTSFRMAD
jgi:hypothetical protein